MVDDDDKFGVSSSSISRAVLLDQLSKLTSLESNAFTSLNSTIRCLFTTVALFIAKFASRTQQRATGDTLFDLVSQGSASENFKYYEHPASSFKPHPQPPAVPLLTASMCIYSPMLVNMPSDASFNTLPASESYTRPLRLFICSHGALTNVVATSALLACLKYYSRQKRSTEARCWIAPCRPHTAPVYHSPKCSTPTTC